MPYYRIVFVNNEIVSCKQAKKYPKLDPSHVYFEQDKGRLIFAIVFAGNEQTARGKVKYALTDFNKKRKD